MALAFIVIFAGFLSVLAPCVLPVLPIILAGSLGEKSKKSAFIITTSLVISIIVFTGLLKASTVFINVPQTFWTYLSATLITILGLTYIFPLTWSRISVWLGFENSKKFLEKTDNVQNSTLKLVLIGASIGPVFSSCSPTYSLLLASIFPVSFTQGIFYTALYSIAFGGMLYLVAIGGQRFINRLHFYTDDTGIFRKTLGGVFVFVGLFIYTGYATTVETALIARVNINNFEQIFLDKYLQGKSLYLRDPNNIPKPVVNSGIPIPNLAIPDGFPAPEFPKEDATWINSKPLTLQDLRGKVVIIDFWTYSCINCQRTIPYMVAWDKKYRDKGLVIIGAHTPEFSFEQIKENVVAAAKADNIEYPIVLDNKYALWNAYNNEYWPAKYFIDRNGKIRHFHFGEGDYEESEKVIQYLLSEGVNENIDTGTVNIAENAIAGAYQSPETYLGTDKRERYTDGTDPNKLSANTWTLTGNWQHSGEYISSGESASLFYNFNAKDVYLVLSGSGYVTASINEVNASKQGILGESFKDGGKLTVNGDRLYHIIHAKNFLTNTLLRLDFTKDIKAFAFTFGS